MRQIYQTQTSNKKKYPYKNKTISGKKMLLLFTFIIMIIPGSIMTYKISMDTANKVSRNLSNQISIDTPLVKPAADPTAFISKWNTSITNTGSSATNQIKLPLTGEASYDFIVDWGDGYTDRITITNYSSAIHTYTLEGIYEISITGTIIGWQFEYQGDRLKLLEIQQWGCLNLGNLGSYFRQCENFNLTATDNLNLTGTTNLNSAFLGCSNLGSSGGMGNWNVSRVTDMGNMFYNAGKFDQPLGDWDVSSVINMAEMFAGADAFNQPIGDWNVSSVISMSTMFYYAETFNQPLGDWDVSSVTLMDWMFLGAKNFNQPLGNWNVSSVTTMWVMFSGAKNFDQPLGDWNVSSVTTMNYMFESMSLSSENYDHLLIGWSQLPLQNSVRLFADGSYYLSSQAKIARQYIIDTFNWVIIDLGEELQFVLEPISSTSTPGMIDLSWDFISGVLSYDVYRDTMEFTDVTGMTPIASTTNLLYRDQNLSNGTYYYVIVAQLPNGYTLISNVQNTTVKIESSNTDDTIKQGIPSYPLEGIAIFGLIAILWIKQKHNKY